MDRAHAALFGGDGDGPQHHRPRDLPVNGVVNKQLVRTALEHATVHVSSTEVIEDATGVLPRPNRSRGAEQRDSSQWSELHPTRPGWLHVYPSFVDIHSDYAMPEAQREGWGRGPQDLSDKKGALGERSRTTRDTRG